MSQENLLNGGRWPEKAGRLMPTPRSFRIFAKPARWMCTRPLVAADPMLFCPRRAVHTRRADENIDMSAVLPAERPPAQKRRMLRPNTIPEQNIRRPWCSRCPDRTTVRTGLRREAGRGQAGQDRRASTLCHTDLKPRGRIR